MLLIRKLLSVGCASILVASLAACSSTASQAPSPTGQAPSPGQASTPGSEPPAASASAEPTEAADIAALKALTDQYRGIPEFIPPGPAFDASKAKGKTIFQIPLSSAIGFVQTIDNGHKEVANMMGINLVDYPNDGTPASWVQGMEQAIARKVDLILLSASPNPAQIQPQLIQAKNAGIPVISTHQAQPLPCWTDDTLKSPRFGDLPICFSKGDIDPNVAANVTAFVAGPLAPQAYIEAAYAIYASGGHANILIVHSPDIYDSDGIVKILKNEFATKCSDCKVTDVGSVVPKWNTEIPGLVQTALTRDPTINYVLPLFDSMSQQVVAGILGAGRQDSVKEIVTFNGTPFVLKMIQDDAIVQADLGENLNWLAWADMDQAMRILAGQPPVEDEFTPIRIFDDENVREAGVPPADNTGYGTAYQDGYKKLWGVAP